MATCSNCGTAGQGSFCTNCGTPLGSDAATNVAAERANIQSENTGQATYYTPQSVAAAPFEGYESASSRPPQPQAAPEPVSQASTISSMSAPRRGSLLLPTLTAVATIAVLALVAYLFLRPNNDNNNVSAPVVSPGSSTSVSQQPTSETQTSSSSSTAQPTQTETHTQVETAAPQPAETTTVTQTAEAPQTSSGSSESASSSESADPSTALNSEGAGADQAVKASTGENDYLAARRGSSVTIYEAAGSDIKTAGTVNLQGQVGSIDFISLSECSKPILIHNAGSSKGSSAYGWDGSGYQAYLSGDKGNMYPTAGDGGSIYAYGVNEYNGGIEYRDAKGVERGQGNHFYKCTGDSSSDVLVWDKAK